MSRSRSTQGFVGLAADRVRVVSVLVLVVALAALCATAGRASAETFVGSFNRISGAGGYDGMLRPWGVAVDAHGHVYVADTYNHRIDQFSADGTFVAAWGRKGEFAFPLGVAVDAHGHVYVADTHNQRIEKFKDDRDCSRLFDWGCRLVTAWGSRGSGGGQFSHP